MNIKALEKGFTLVELAIVLMIVGLLIGGVLRGQELLANSKVTSTIQQVKAYTGALKTFTDEYNNIPGDMPNASTKLPGCQTGNSNNCINGNGDSVVGVLDQTVNDHPWTNIPNAIASENTQFWKHLALAHLITGVDPSAATPEWGRSHPTASLGSGFFARYSVLAGGANYTNISGHILVLRNLISGNWVCDTMSQLGSCAISGKRASQLDRKMDDGMAVTGNVIAISSGWANGCGMGNTGINGPNGYAETNEITSCDMMFQM